MIHDSTEESKFEEVWVELPDGQTLCALINDTVGWLMYLRENEDAGFSSRNPDYDGPPTDEIEYRLSNGQHDKYPAAWAYPVSEIRKALTFFEKERKPPPFISWHNDSEDGTII